MVELVNSDLSTSDVTLFGKRIFSLVGESQPSIFTKNFWSGRLMEWSMTKADFKKDLFRLVDVLPALESDAEVVEHVHSYLSSSDVSDLFPVGKSVVSWGFKGSKSSLRGKALAFIVRKSVKEMALQFIAGENPKSAGKSLRRLRKSGLAFTVDLLGEYSINEDEATVYVDRYKECLTELGRQFHGSTNGQPLIANHIGESTPVCISVKLSALYSQCSSLNISRSVQILGERLGEIARKAKEVNALLYVDAEDTAHNPVIYETFKYVFGSGEFKDFFMPGIVVQAYAKEAPALLEDLLKFAQNRGAPIAIRLVKGAYWDSETAMAAQNGWQSPLFSKKKSTDAQFERLSAFLLDNHDMLFPALGSHNIRSLSFACCYARDLGIEPTKFEIQTLYGMAEPIAKAFQQEGYLTRVYVPVGELVPGMGYLVRRLLENTSNESFLRHTFFDEQAVEELLLEPKFSE